MLSGSAEPADGTALPGGLTPVALLVLAERLREDAAATVRYLLDQGITIKVLSGDAPRTVSAIAGRVGIPAHDAMCDASELGDDETSVGGALRDSNVLGRVRPGQKLAAVRALQADGHVVAMVGDGVNDVQALKQADLGIAMGSGSQSSRSVARVVLLDSSFAAIPAVLAEGRRVIANIERVANLFVTKTVYAAALAIVVGLSGIPFPFFPRHLTIVSTLTIGVPGFFLALAAGAPRARSGFTRRVLAFTIPAGLAAAGAAAISYALARSADAATAEQSRTATLLALFAISLWVLALIARPLNAARVVLIAALAAAFATVFTWPFARQVFSLPTPARRRHPPGGRGRAGRDRRAHPLAALRTGQIAWLADQVTADVRASHRAHTFGSSVPAHHGAVSGRTGRDAGELNGRKPTWTGTTIPTRGRSACPDTARKARLTGPIRPAVRAPAGLPRRAATASGESGGCPTGRQPPCSSAPARPL